MSRSICVAFAIVAATAACTVKTETSSDTTLADSTMSIPGNAQVVPAPPPSTGPAQQIPPGSPDSIFPPASGTSFTISPNAYGPLRVGMTVSQAATAMGGGFSAPSGYSGGCGYAALTRAPAGLAVMLQDGRIARFEVRSGAITTAEGARIGDTEARIKSIYGSRVTTTPHKYLAGGHYLTVGSGANRVVFETDGSKVTEYRSGKTPEVEQVERCG